MSTLRDLTQELRPLARVAWLAGDAQVVLGVWSSASDRDDMVERDRASLELTATEVAARLIACYDALEINRLNEAVLQANPAAMLRHSVKLRPGFLVAAARHQHPLAVQRIVGIEPRVSLAEVHAPPVRIRASLLRSAGGVPKTLGLAAARDLPFRPYGPALLGDPPALVRRAFSAMFLAIRARVGASLLGVRSCMGEADRPLAVTTLRPRRPFALGKSERLGRLVLRAHATNHALDCSGRA